MKSITRRTVLLSAAALIAAPRVARAADTVRFGVLYPNLTTVIHAIARKTGAYAKHGLNVVETRFKSGQTVEGVELGEEGPGPRSLAGCTSDECC